ncbi:hypothetical protein D9M72_513600 [compost metagenome]
MNPAGSVAFPLTHPHTAMLHGVDDVLFHQRTGNAQLSGDFQMGQAIDLAQQKTLAAQPWQFRQGTLEHVQTLAVIEDLVR